MNLKKIISSCKSFEELEKLDFGLNCIQKGLSISNDRELLHDIHLLRGQIKEELEMDLE